MFEGIHIARFRAFDQLDVVGLGRFNLIVGRNDAGKTAFLEAVALASRPTRALSRALRLQNLRDPNLDRADFRSAWLPLFHRQDPSGTIELSASSLNGPLYSASIRHGRLEEASVDSPNSGREPFILECVAAEGSTLLRSTISNQGPQGGLVLTGNGGSPMGWSWIGPTTTRSADDEAISQFSYLSLNRRGQEVLDLLRLIEPRLRRIEVLSLNGRRPDVFVDIEDAGPLLSLRMMGDGLNRAFDIGVSILASQDGVLCVDEIDSGLHHTTLDRMFRWLSASAEAESVQVFATTHSEECVHAARAAFPEGNDAFRLIRLDRTTKGIEAKLYNRDLVLAAQEMGVEIRG